MKSTSITRPRTCGSQKTMCAEHIAHTCMRAQLPSYLKHHRACLPAHSSLGLLQLPGAYYASSTSVVRNTVYVMAGTWGPYGSIKRVQAYFMLTDTVPRCELIFVCVCWVSFIWVQWQYRNNIPLARSWPASESIGHHIFVSGGMYPTGPSTSFCSNTRVQLYDTSADQWQYANSVCFCPLLNNNGHRNNRFHADAR